MHNIIKYQGGKKFKNTKVGAFAGKYGDALGAAGSMFSGIGGQIKGFTETQSSINSGIHSLMQAAGPAGRPSVTGKRYDPVFPAPPFPAASR